ncbi:MAG TPA: hypothetical protein VF316_02810 [Polyangiaceae bacterium]
MDDDETEADVIARVDALYRDGLPPRTTVPVLVDGTPRFLVNGLFLECLACGHRVPQSRTRQSPPARALWIHHHLGCRADAPSP